MRKSVLFLLITIVLFTMPVSVLAKRLLPGLAIPSKPGTKTTGLVVAVKFRTDRKASIMTISNLSTAKNIDYLLSYNTRGTTQGASGTITTTNEDPVIRELLFGSCSHGVCRYDTGITNAKLAVTITYKDGRKVIKRYRLKV